MEKNINIIIKYIIAIETINFQIGRKFIEFLTSKDVLDANTFADYKNVFDLMLHLDEKYKTYDQKDHSYIVFDAVIFLQNKNSWNEKVLSSLKTDDIKKIVQHWLIEQQNIYLEKQYQIKKLLSNLDELEEFSLDDEKEDEEEQTPTRHR